MKQLKRIFSIMMLTIMVTVTSIPMEANAATKLLVHFIDVGQGDAILVQYGSSYSLIDTGVEKKYSQLSTYLKKIKVKKITNLVVTHPDADHMGGADLVIKNYGVKNIYMTNYSSNSGEYKEMISAIKKYKVKRVNVKKGSKISFGGLKANVLSADTSLRDSNESSIVLKLTHGKKSFLFTGDISAKVENKIAAAYDVNVDVLKVSHHGSSYSSAVSFIKETSPQYSIVSVGANNNYGHPNGNVVNRLNKYSKTVYRTDKKGTIVITSTGSKLTSKTVKTTGSTSSSSSSSSSSSGSSNTTKPVGSTVYVTKTGKKYHARKCGRGTFTKATIKAAKARGLTACSKCY
ncbi:late competence protein comeC, DNA transport [Lachnospiraceae bacterium KM106-2]|nr:late competence protein comeC, DNA transport [Lachnospiraceae bacterium KM106-2]